MRLMVGNLGHDFEKSPKSDQLEFMMWFFCALKDANCNIQ